MNKIKLNKRSIVIFLVAVLLVGVVFDVYRYHLNSKYNSAEFKSYKEGRLRCGQFYGGVHETDAEFYHDMQQSHGVIAC